MSAAQTQELAASLDGNDGVYFVPALTGLGSPHWDPYARGTIVGAGGRAQRHPVGVAREIQRRVEAATLLEKRAARDHVDGTADRVGRHPRHRRLEDLDALDVVDGDLIELERAAGLGAIGCGRLIAV